MQFVRLKNWEKYQHYKYRSPVWIKLYQDLLTSHMWVASSDASRVLAIACMVLAAKTDNKIPLDPDYIRKVSYLSTNPDFTELVASDFLEIVEDSKGNGASKPLAERYQDARPEKSREEKKQLPPPSGSFLRFWGIFPSGPRKKSQGKCWEIWRKKDFDLTANEILAHVEALKSSDDWQRGYAPGPLPYLNQRQWEGAEVTPSGPKFDA